MPSATRWVESLSPWPTDGFGTERMRALLRELAEPQERFEAVHIVGTNGKSTTTRLAEALLSDAGLSVGAYLSPHVRGWSERIRIDGEEADFEAAVAAVRPAAEALGATQFETLTAAALGAFAEAGVDVAVVEAGLGGRHDATNVLDARVVVLTSVALDHMDVLGETREAIAAEKLAVVGPGCTVVLGEPEWQELAEENGAAAVVVTGRSNLALAVAAAESFLGRPVDPHAADSVALPGRLERRGESPLEIWDGAHNLAGIGWLLPRLPSAPSGGWTVLASILRDKRPGMMLEALSVLGPVLVATESRNGRALPATELAALASAHFERVESVPDAEAARARALELAGRDGALLVTGSLYLLAELSGEHHDL
ncbi:MAG TPA: Mur ligase family protein [Gaiellaceae bacterium]|nr:Mur ligase family protein [Gaiellaceae bacterium]